MAILEGGAELNTSDGEATRLRSNWNAEQTQSIAIEHVYRQPRVVNSKWTETGRVEIRPHYSLLFLLASSSDSSVSILPFVQPILRHLTLFMNCIRNLDIGFRFNNSFLKLLHKILCIYSNIDLLQVLREVAGALLL